MLRQVIVGNEKAYFRVSSLTKKPQNKNKKKQKRMNIDREN